MDRLHQEFDLDTVGFVAADIDTWTSTSRFDVQFFTVESARALLTGAFGRNAIREEAAVRPWSNNVAYLVRL